MMDKVENYLAWLEEASSDVLDKEMQAKEIIQVYTYTFEYKRGNKRDNVYYK